MAVSLGWLSGLVYRLVKDLVLVDVDKWFG